ncbi:protein TIS11 [Lutzomyia longipalpis]|uniref:protein TIS11 n=1 Tax=Lutzomyia longipalpis TaxID=7200 RepID=UPI002483897F|nr:protein TIS11 [Lutzomyia longipalpis]XP_055695846.1 protein TIS11 [Lutzomyia longipalpis]XP_055695847.1 protein TIS11 [Lutzomyia longipalpis]
MSTAIMHQTAYYDFGDLLLKSQNQTRSNGNVVSGGGIQAIASATNNNVIGATNANKNYSVSLSGHNGAPPQHSLLQQQLIVAAAQQHQQQHNHKMIIHSALQRAVSHPHGAAGATNGTNVATFVNTIIENLGGHRKLERTQSEPLPQVNTSRYKTELCRPFEEAGECKYGDKCQFAHGMYELRNLQRHPKYKTELCRTFHSVGYCPYGPRCHFVHNAEEARLGMQNQQNSTQQQQQQRLVLLNRGAAMAAAAAAGQLGGNLPLSPALSMSTGSDRASPTGSLSPTNSVPSFFGEVTPSSAVEGSLMAHAIFPQGGFMAPPPQPPSLSPPQSPRELSPGASPPPNELETRLPVFNRLSSTIDSLNNLAI